MIKAVLKTSVLLAGLLSVVAAQAGNYYRYTKEDGTVAINHSVPPEYVAGGYEVLNRQGRVVEVVPPQAAEEAADEQQSTATSEDNEQQKREDTMLLRSYSSRGELESARDRRLSLLDREINIVERTLSESSIQLEDSRTKAANYQRGGKAVPEVLLKNIEGLGKQIQEAEQMSRVRKAERQAVSEKYQRYIERFAVLKGEVKTDVSAPEPESGEGSSTVMSEAPDSGVDSAPDPERTLPSRLAIDPASAPSDDG